VSAVDFRRAEERDGLAMDIGLGFLTFREGTKRAAS